MTIEQIIEAIETFIRINGDRFKLFYLKYDMKGEGLPFRKIVEIEQQFGSLPEYIQYFIDKYKPQSIEVITKKPNGNSHGIHPKSRIFSLENVEQSNKQQRIPTPFPSPDSSGLSGIQKIHSLETSLLTRELQKETNRAERYEGMYNELRDKHFKLEKDHALMKEKAELEREKERLKHENSLTSIFKEVKPELFGLLGNMTRNNQVAATTLQGVESDKGSLLSNTLSQLPEAMQNEAIEVLIRYLNLDATERGKVLTQLQEQTQHLDDQIEDVLTPNET